MSDSIVTVDRLKEMVKLFILERDWDKFHDSKSLSMSISIEAAELMEIFQWVRTSDTEKMISDNTVKGKVVDEIADILIYTIAFCSKNNIDISKSIEQKLKKNSSKYPIEKYKGKYSLNKS